MAIQQEAEEKEVIEGQRGWRKLYWVREGIRKTECQWRGLISEPLRRVALWLSHVTFKVKVRMLEWWRGTPLTPSPRVSGPCGTQCVLDKLPVMLFPRIRLSPPPCTIGLSTHT